MPVALTRCDAIGSAIERGTDGRAARCTTARRVAHHLVERVGIEDGALDERDVEVAQVVAVAGREVVERDDGLTGSAQAAAEVRADEPRASRHDDAHDRPGYVPVTGHSAPASRSPSTPPLRSCVPRLFLSPPDVGAA